MKVKKASETINFINNSGYVPIFTAHHVQEIIQHENRGVVSNRWSLISKFINVAWICCYDDDRILGSIFDIHKLEVLHILDNGNVKFDSLRNTFNRELVKYCTGESFVDSFERLYMEVRQMGAIDINRNREVESISHLQDKRISDTRLRDLYNSKLRPPAESQRLLMEYQLKLDLDLKERGDRNLFDTTSAATKFVSEVAENSQQLYVGGGSSLYEIFVKNAGVRLDQVTPNTTVGELGYLSIYNKRLELILDALKIPRERAQDVLHDDSCIWRVWKYLDKAMKNEKMAHGSNVIDKDMSVLAMFVDVFTVDKRVREYFRQIASKMPDLSEAFGRIEKLTDYAEIKFIKAHGHS